GAPQAVGFPAVVAFGVAGSVEFGDQAFVAVQEPRDAFAGLLSDPSAHRVVLVLADGLRVVLDLDQTLGSVVDELACPGRWVAGGFCFGVAVGGVGEAVLLTADAVAQQLVVFVVRPRAGLV